MNFQVGDSVILTYEKSKYTSTRLWIVSEPSTEIKAIWGEMNNEKFTFLKNTSGRTVIASTSLIEFAK